MLACRVRRPCRAGCDRSLHYGRALHQRKASLFRCKSQVQRASCDLQREAGIRVERSPAPLRWLSLGRWRNTQACRARAPGRAGCDRAFARWNGTAPAGGLSPSMQDRGATCDLWPPAAHSRPSCDRSASATALAVSRKVAKHSSLPRGQAVSRWLRLVFALRKGTAPAEGLSLLVQVPGVTCELWPSTRNRLSHGTLASATALAVSREVAKDANLPRARPGRAGCDRSSYDGMALHRREASLLRCKTMVRRASCGLQRAAGIRLAHAQAPLWWLSLGRWQNAQACRARAPCRTGCGWPTHYKRALRRRDASLFRCKTVV